MESGTMRHSLRRCQREHSCQAEWLQITSGCHGEIKVDLMEVLQLSLCAICVCVCVCTLTCFFAVFKVTSVFHQFKLHSIPSPKGSVLTYDPCEGRSISHGLIYRSKLEMAAIGAASRDKVTSLLQIPCETHPFILS